MPSPGLRRRRWSVAYVLGLLAPALGGCAMSFPIGSLMPGDDVTGSNSPVPFGRLLDEEDRRRETAALATALDLQGNGAPVKWDNPRSGHGGTLAAAGKAYNAESKICRPFTSELKQTEGNRKLEGTACLASAGEWKVVATKPVKA